MISFKKRISLISLGFFFLIIIYYLRNRTFYITDIELKKYINKDKNIFSHIQIDETNNIAYYYLNITNFNITNFNKISSYIMKPIRFAITITSKDDHVNKINELYKNNVKISTIYKEDTNIFLYFSYILKLYKNVRYLLFAYVIFNIIYKLHSISKNITDSSSKFRGKFTSDNLRSFLQIDSTTGTLVTNIKTRFSDVIGLKSIKNDLLEYVGYLKYRRDYIDSGFRLPKGLLFVGAPGTGKTLLAKAFAGEAGVSFIELSGSDFLDPFVGGGVKKVESVFKLARNNTPAVIFIDEIDAIGGNRTNKYTSSDAYSKILNKLLTEMDGFRTEEELLVIAATNIVNTLDPALTRSGRFDRKIVFDKPNIKERHEMFNLYINKVKVSSVLKQNINLCINKLSKMTSGLTGADISNIVNQAIGNYLKRKNKYKNYNMDNNKDIKDIDNKINIESKKEFYKIFDDIKNNNKINKILGDITEFSKNNKEFYKIFKKKIYDTNKEKICEDFKYINNKELEEDIKYYKENNKIFCRILKKKICDNKINKINIELNKIFCNILKENRCYKDEDIENLCEKDKKKICDEFIEKICCKDKIFCLKEKICDEDKEKICDEDKEKICDEDKEKICDEDKDINIITYKDNKINIVSTKNNKEFKIFFNIFKEKICGEDKEKICGEYKEKIYDEDGLTYNDLIKSIDDVMIGMEKRERTLSKIEINYVAHHEAGHSLVAYMLKNSESPIKISIIPRGYNALGYSQQESIDKKIHTMNELYASICVCLGGRISEKIIFNHLSTGASNDLEKATKIVYNMLTVYGMSNTIGALSVKIDTDNPYQELISNITKREIDMEARKILNKAERIVMKLLIDNKKSLVKIAEYLLENEIMDKKDIDKLIGEISTEDSIEVNN